MDTDDPVRGVLGRVVGIGASAGGVDALIRLYATSRRTCPLIRRALGTGREPPHALDLQAAE